MWLNVVRVSRDGVHLGGLRLVNAVNAILVLFNGVDIEVSHVDRFPLSFLFRRLNLVEESADGEG